MVDYFNVLVAIPNVCEKFQTEIKRSFFTSHNYTLQDSTYQEWFCFTPAYQEFLNKIKSVVNICDLFGVGILDENKNDMLTRISKLETPDFIRKRENFETEINYIKSTFESSIEELKIKFDKLSEEEKGRLNEAIHCLNEECHYASVAMAVSAIEDRLSSLMKNKNPDINLEDKTLGELINMCLTQDEYKDVVDREHRPLLQLCNEYRIFSVHPKRKRITRRIAVSVINLAFEFLLAKEN